MLDYLYVNWTELNWIICIHISYWKKKHHFHFLFLFDIYQFNYNNRSKICCVMYHQVKKKNKKISFFLSFCMLVAPYDWYISVLKVILLIKPHKFSISPAILCNCNKTVILSLQNYHCKRFYSSKLRLSGLCQSVSLSALIYTSHLHQHLFLAPENSSSLPVLLLLTPAPVSSSLTRFSDFYSSLTPSWVLSPSTSTPHWVQTTFKGRGHAAYLKAHA